MERAAACLVGEHDFKSFCKVSSAIGKPTCRCVHSVSFGSSVQMGEELIEFTITGNAFLHSMVRTIVGQPGGGRFPSPRARVARGRARRLRPVRRRSKTAPARGLCFMDVAYDDGVLLDCPDA